MKNIAVAFGGASSEREISVITGIFAVNLLRGGGYRVLPVLLGEAGEAFLFESARTVEEVVEGKGVPVAFERGGLFRQRGLRRKICAVDCALNCCHGGMGEDGTLSALLAWAKIPLASPALALSSLAMNKEYSQIVARGLEIPVVPSFSVSEGEWAQSQESTFARARELGYPVIVKPSTLGSSIGITVANSDRELTAALTLAFTLDVGALVERYLAHKRDLNCAAVRLLSGVKISPVEEVFSASPILTFGEKYEGSGERQSQIPALVPPEISERVQEYTARIYTAFHGRGVVRADFLYCEGEVYFNELNTVPGSLAYYLFGESLHEAKELFSAVIEERLANPDGKKRTVTTGILQRSVFGGAKGCKTGKNLV